MSGLENGDGLNKCIIPRPHSRVEVVPRSTTKSDKTGTVLKYFIMMFNNKAPVIIEKDYASFHHTTPYLRQVLTYAYCTCTIAVYYDFSPFAYLRHTTPYL